MDFLPEPAAVVAIAKQIRSSHRAFPLFGTGRLFLERPERHRVRITSVKEGVPLFQVGDGPIAFDRAAVERDAFRQLRSKYYEEHVEQGEAPKGTFTKIAKLRGSGLLLGPTNYHSYQPTLRRIYEERYSRRMDFAEFQQREIEIVSDEQTVNDWKEQARNLVTWTTTQEPEQKTFKTLADVEAHFRQHYLPQEVRSGMTLEANGAVARASGDRSMNASIRLAVERERGFPVGVVNAMRPILTDAGLHFFKHRKRVVYVSTVRPLHHPVGQPAKENVLAVLNAIDAMPRCSRHDLGVKVLGEHFEAPEKEAEKTALASDLHYLLLAGHVIEFADGRLDLPLAPKAQGQAQGAADQGQEHEHEAQEGHEHDKEREPRPGHEDEPPAPPEKGHDTPAENVAAVSPVGATEELLPEDEHATVVADEPLIEPEPEPEAAHRDVPANPSEETHDAPSESLETVSVQPEEEPATVVATEPSVIPETVPVAETASEGLPTKSTVEL
ncbi:MAG TPA: hypothetical protein VFG14_01415 [Chthoniobacteraceae bacterium]|nr:hypothetical protein [Chthoniobacteraceae bacterium]